MAIVSTLRSYGSSLRESALALPTPHCSLVLNLGNTGPGRRLPQRQPGSQVAVQLPQFMQPQHANPQPQAILHHNFAVGLVQTQQKKGHDFGLHLSGTVDTYTGGK